MTEQSQNTPPLLAEVAVPVASLEPLTYSISTELRQIVKIGSRVVVPFQKKYKTGVITAFPEKSELEKIREIVDIADNDPPLPEATMELCRWISQYYICSLGEVLAAAHPAGMLGESKKAVRLLDNFDAGMTGLEAYAPVIARILERLKKKPVVSVQALRKDLGYIEILSVLLAMEKRGMVEIFDAVPEKKYRPKYITLLSLNPELTEDYIETWLKERDKKSPKQAAVVRFLRNSEPVPRKTVMTSTKVSSSALKVLVDRGILREKLQEVSRDTAVNFEENYTIVHTDAQKEAIAAIDLALERKVFHPFLLHGVTGSGKTEVYLEAISRCLQTGKTAMVLVPEIALTPQIASRFRKRFGAQVVIIHSRISAGEKYDSWRKLAVGRARVVIGARSALFSPMKNLGLIVVDEEHEQSFKQMNRPHYNARDCAVWLGSKLNIPVVLGSATPSVETYFNAKNDKYRFLELPDRVAGGKFSTFHLVDLTKDNSLIGKTSISPLLMEKIEDRLEHGDRSIILQNRRGFSVFIKCKHCGGVEKCENCSVTLTYHITNRRMRCHICGFQKPAPSYCTFCKGAELMHCGSGTQKVEEELSGMFPDARIVRMDLDTTSGVDSHFRILEAFAQGRYDILLGTQMVAKGLDFPEVTLVGIISADTELLRPDFRAEERTFRLLVQAAGRSGRHRPGEVVVQTYNPEHPIFKLVQYNDYIGFYLKTISERQGLKYPPFGRLVKINISGPEENSAAEAAIYLGELIPREGIKVLGPSPALLSKVKRRFYFHIIIKTGNYSFSRLDSIKKSLQAARGEALKKYRSKDVSIEIDVDPMEMH